MSAAMTPINPESLGAPRGYSNGMLAPPGGRLLFVAGQIAWDAGGQLRGTTFIEQFEAALGNVLAVVRAAGGGPEHIGRINFYVTSCAEYLADLSAVGEAYRRVMGRCYPAMALLQVAALVVPEAKVEIEATAVVPEPQSR
ncbi:MAG TPA: RidA family protein [Thermoanaerobaculia bacterium]|nr:RidA family protein [Thermoanaerobaculia bacterium]